MVDVTELYGPYGDSITRERREILARTVVQIKRAYQRGSEWDCFVLWESISILEEQLWMQLQLEAPIREAIKRFQRAERELDDKRE